MILCTGPTILASIWLTTIHLCLGSQLSSPVSILFQALAFKYHLYKHDQSEVFNSVLIRDGNHSVHISAFLPDQGEYVLDVYGKDVDTQMTYSQLVSLQIRNTGTGVNRTCPKLCSTFYKNKGTTILSPLYGPLNEQKNVITEEILFDFHLPGVISAAINPGWNYLTKSYLILLK